MTTNHIYLVICIVILLPIFSFSQSTNDDKSFQSTSYTIKDPIANLRMSCYFRFLGYVCNFQNMYPLDIDN